MKLNKTLKQSLLFVLVYLMVGAFWRLINPYYKIIESELILQSGRLIIMGTFLCYGFIIHWICEKYAPLKGTPIFFLSMLFVVSTLLAWLMTWSGVTEWMMCFIRPLFQHQALPNYQVFFRKIFISMLGFFPLMPYCISLVSGARLLTAMIFRIL